MLYTIASFVDYYFVLKANGKVVFLAFMDMENGMIRLIGMVCGKCQECGVELEENC